jgi:undecaprenyl-diphosphatase
VVSFLVAIVVVHYFLRWVKTRGFGPFAVWRLAAGGVVLWWAWRGRIG